MSARSASMFEADVKSITDKLTLEQAQKAVAGELPSEIMHLVEAKLGTAVAPKSMSVVSRRLRSKISESRVASKKSQNKARPGGQKCKQCMEVADGTDATKLQAITVLNKILEEVADTLTKGKLQIDTQTLFYDNKIETLSVDIANCYAVIENAKGEEAYCQGCADQNQINIKNLEDEERDEKERCENERISEQKTLDEDTLVFNGLDLIFNATTCKDTTTTATPSTTGLSLLQSDSVQAQLRNSRPHHQKSHNGQIVSAPHYHRHITDEVGLGHAIDVARNVFQQHGKHHFTGFLTVEQCENRGVKTTRIVGAPHTSINTAFLDYAVEQRLRRLSRMSASAPNFEQYVNDTYTTVKPAPAAAYWAGKCVQVELDCTVINDEIDTMRGHAQDIMQAQIEKMEQQRITCETNIESIQREIQVETTNMDFNLACVSRSKGVQEAHNSIARLREEEKKVTVTEWNEIESAYNASHEANLVKYCSVHKLISELRLTPEPVQHCATTEWHRDDCLNEKGNICTCEQDSESGTSCTQRVWRSITQQPSITKCKKDNTIFTGEEGCHGAANADKTMIQGPGASCPDQNHLEEYAVCGDNPCAVDCVIEDWTAWGPCSEKCQGTQSRHRVVVQQQAHHGDPCPNLWEQQVCGDDCGNTCQLSDWSPWGWRNNEGGCSKECLHSSDPEEAAGIQFRTRSIIREGDADNKCPDELSPERFQRQSCNRCDCGPDPVVCKSKVDVCFAVDASGSISYWMPEDGVDVPPAKPQWYTGDLKWAEEATFSAWMDFMDAMSEKDTEKDYQWGWEGWAVQKYFLGTMVNKLTLGEQNAQVAVVHFAGEDDVDNVMFGTDGNETMSFDKDDVLEKISAMPYAGTATATAVGMARCAEMLQAGRSDADQVIVIITDGEPSHPAAVDAKARELKDSGFKLMWVVVDHENKNIAAEFRQECPVDGGDGYGTIYPEQQNPEGRRCWASEPVYDYLYTSTSYQKLASDIGESAVLYDRMILATCPAVEHAQGWYCDEGEM